MTCLVFDGHQAGSDDDDVQLAESAGPFPTMVVEEVEDEDEEEDRSESYPDNRERELQTKLVHQIKFSTRGLRCSPR